MMSKGKRIGASVAIGAVLFSAAASAAEVRYEMESASEFEADAWFQNGAPVPTFSGGQMTVTTAGASEWILYNKADSPTRWWNYVNAQKGWWVEARLHLISGPDAATCFDGGPGLWIHDGLNLIKFTFTQTRARISYPMLAAIELDPTDAFHTYRVQNLGGSHIQVLVDGEVQLDLDTLGAGGGTEAITIGDLGGCGSSSAVWEYLAYDTAAPGTETDDTDGDGIEAAVDLCPGVEDTEQLDADADRLGDACDACPLDPQNDYDQDGLCADEDVCPNSAENIDSDSNGICDSEECLNTGFPQGGAGIPCQGPGCCFIGIDPVSDPLAPTQNGSAGSAGSGSDTGGTANDTTVPHDKTQSTPSADPQPSSAGSANSNPTNSESAAQASSGCSLSPRRDSSSSALLAALAALGLLVSRRKRAAS